MDFASDVSDATRERLLKRFGRGVAPWWDRLPATVDRLAQQWFLDVGEPVGRGNTSLVVRCRERQGRAAVLKLTPEVELARAEATALRSWRPSNRVPEVWRHDASCGALLLEAMPDETPVAEQREHVPIDEIARLIAALHRTGAPEVGGGVVPLADRVEFMFDHWRKRYGHRPELAPLASIDRVERGYELGRALAAGSAASVLLHGDLHPSNVLDAGAGRSLVAIDPRPCVGDPAFDAVDWVYWPRGDPAQWRPRCDALADALGLDATRIWEWCRTFAAMLAATAASRGDEGRAEAFLDIAP